MKLEHAKSIEKLYPDLLAAGGLAVGLEQALVEVGSSLHVRTLDEGLDAEQKNIMKGFPAYARVEQAERFSQVYIGVEQRMFLYDFWQRGVMLADAATHDLKEVANSIHRWITGLATTRQLANEFPFVKPEKSAEAFESGSEVEYRWNWYENWIPKKYPELISFFEVAKHMPELRKLFPFTSHNCMCFSRCTGYPYTDDCPAVIPKTDAGCRNILPSQYEVRLQSRSLGSGDGHQAAEIVVRHLPLNCGPAIAGTAETIPRIDK
ncbi:MAG: hypothetical protein KDA89_22985 [Planctomycetaceae bacterium]|nr:hypothetical protein [Planctomycetaceae bacterium]